jgi:hypothetical protein
MCRARSNRRRRGRSTPGKRHTAQCPRTARRRPSCRSGTSYFRAGPRRARARNRSADRSRRRPPFRRIRNRARGSYTGAPSGAAGTWARRRSGLRSCRRKRSRSGNRRPWSKTNRRSPRSRRPRRRIGAPDPSLRRCATNPCVEVTALARRRRPAHGEPAQAGRRPRQGPIERLRLVLSEGVARRRRGGLLGVSEAERERQRQTPSQPSRTALARPRAFLSGETTSLRSGLSTSVRVASASSSRRK